MSMWDEQTVSTGFPAVVPLRRLLERAQPTLVKASRAGKAVAVRVAAAQVQFHTLLLSCVLSAVTSPGSHCVVQYMISRMMPCLPVRQQGHCRETCRCFARSHEHTFQQSKRAVQVLSLMAFIGSDDPSATADIMQTLEGLRSAGGTSKQGDPPQDPCTWCDAYLKYTTA